MCLDVDHTVQSHMDTTKENSLRRWRTVTLLATQDNDGKPCNHRGGTLWIGEEAKGEHTI